jgi:predicted nucleic acid-binding protein
MMVEIDASAVTDFLSQHEVEEPIVIKRQGAPHAVMIPYEIFQAMHRENRRAVRVDELTDEEIEGILNSKPSAESYQYNDELDD